MIVTQGSHQADLEYCTLDCTSSSLSNEKEDTERGLPTFEKCTRKRGPIGTNMWPAFGTSALQRGGQRLSPSSRLLARAGKMDSLRLVLLDILAYYQSVRILVIKTRPKTHPKRPSRPSRQTLVLTPRPS